MRVLWTEDKEDTRFLEGRWKQLFKESLEQSFQKYDYTESYVKEDDGYFTETIIFEDGRVVMTNFGAGADSIGIQKSKLTLWESDVDENDVIFFTYKGDVNGIKDGSDSGNVEQINSDDPNIQD
jgi:hypothetical protein